jgi:hypothetical protein
VFTSEPIVFDLLNKFGLSEENNEVWIRGRYFSDEVQVFFGEREAKVIERDDNMISVVVPKIMDITESTEVQVRVYNLTSMERIPADRILYYTYLVERTNE